MLCTLLAFFRLSFFAVDSLVTVGGVKGRPCLSLLPRGVGVDLLQHGRLWAKDTPRALWSTSQ